MSAAYALGEIGDKGAVDPLSIAALKDEDINVMRQCAARSLESLGWQTPHDNNTVYKTGDEVLPM